MKKLFLILITFLLAAPIGMAGVNDDDDKTTGIKREVRRLHPERERAKAAKKLQEEMSRKAEPKADPWDTEGEVWGTVDVAPLAVKDSAAVTGHRLPDRAADPSQRMTWQEEPVTTPLDQLLPYFVNEDGEYRSKYVSRDSAANEVYFAFEMMDSVPGPLRLCVSYSAESPLHYDLLTFNIDGHDYLFYPLATREGVTPQGVYWEHSDDELTASYRDLVYALAHSHWVMLKLQGAGGVSRVKMLSDGQREDFGLALSLFRLLGGEL